VAVASCTQLPTLVGVCEEGDSTDGLAGRLPPGGVRLCRGDVPATQTSGRISMHAEQVPEKTSHERYYIFRIWWLQLGNGLEWL
jgi:hypothetical protein